MKKRLLIFFGCLWFLSGFPCLAAEAGSESGAFDSVLLDELEFTEIQDALDEVLGEQADFEETFDAVLQGDSPMEKGDWLDQILYGIRKEWGEQKKTFAYLFALLIAAAILTNFSKTFQNEQISEVSFCITYMLLFITASRGFQSGIAITVEALSALGTFMKALIPSYFLAVAMSSSMATAAVFYELVLILIYGVQWLLQYVMVPVVQIYLVLVFVQNLSSEDYLSRLVEFLNSAMHWVLKSILFAVAGFQLIQSMVNPVLDQFRTTVFSKTAAMLPGVGNIANSVTEMFLGSTLLIKNAMGAAALVFLLLLCLVPLVRLGVQVVFYELLAALVQPVSDKRMTGCLAGMGAGARLLFQVVLTGALLFILTIAVVTMTTGRR